MTTGICIWCLAHQMRPDLVPEIYEKYLKLLSNFPQCVNEFFDYLKLLGKFQESVHECGDPLDIWEVFVQTQIQDLLPVNVKPAKSSHMSK